MKTFGENKIYKKNVSLLLEKFSTLHPLLFFASAPRICPDKKRKGSYAFDAKNLQNKNVLFIYGLDLNFLCHLCKIGVFLKKHPPIIVVIEKHIQKLQKFLSQKKSFFFLKNTHFFIEWLDSKSLEIFTRDLAKKFPYKDCAILNAQNVQRSSSFQKFEKELVQALAIEEAYFFERAHPTPLFFSFVKNVQKVSVSFDVAEKFSKKFAKIPAIICGAGPSLEKDIPLLKNLSDKALIFAGGSAISLLSNHEMFFHFALASDPNEKEFLRLKESQAFSSLFFYTLRLHGHILSLLNPPYGYIKSSLGGFLELYLHKHMGISLRGLAQDLSTKALSVTTLALSLAQEFGCDPIIFCGVDLGFFKNKQRYAKGLDFTKIDPKHFLQNERLIETYFLKNNQEQLGFALEAEAILEFVKKYPEKTFVNASLNNKRFDPKIIPTLPLEKIIPKYLHTPFDLSGYIHQCLMQKTPQNFSKDQMISFLNHLKKDLEACKSHLSLVKKDGSKGKIALVETLLKEEEVFAYLFHDYERICHCLSVQHQKPRLATYHGKLLKLAEWIEDFLMSF